MSGSLGLISYRTDDSQPVFLGKIWLRKRIFGRDGENDDDECAPLFRPARASRKLLFGKTFGSYDNMARVLTNVKPFSYRRKWICF